MNNKIKAIEEVLYWLQHTTMSKEEIIKIFKEQLKELQTKNEITLNTSNLKLALGFARSR